MELKRLIHELDEKLKKEKNTEIEKVIKELKHIDENIKEIEARNKAVKKIRDEQYTWLNIKDV